ncbi:HIRAN domain-containing protein [Clostridium sp. LIBA-8841]|uniref:HIRAN domain-containing protein n=1 Tax=Clostridium sp. LIBA-8841 TaxID=2987530 RepID=UPI002AC53902|nr:HIRAN domain-containing protein [Clostridium sp. LIBA-8841]MDZ5252123.1 HIRAN domain-containing protein [Clostridium sp. LIBA-8841]
MSKENELSIISNNASIMNILDKDKELMPFFNIIYLYTLNIAGIRYYIDNDLYLEENEELRLKRESENQYDKYAIAVYNSEKKIGYIPRRNNKVFARLMDGGKSILAKVKCVDYYFDEIEDIQIRLYLDDF